MPVSENKEGGARGSLRERERNYQQAGPDHVPMVVAVEVIATHIR